MSGWLSPAWQLTPTADGGVRTGRVMVDWGLARGITQEGRDLSEMEARERATSLLRSHWLRRIWVEWSPQEAGR